VVRLRPIGARHYAARAQLIQNMMGLFNSPMGQIIGPHMYQLRNLAGMVEEYMGFDTVWTLLKIMLHIFEAGEQEKIKMQIQQDLQSQQAAPSMEEQMVDQQIQQVERQMPPEM
jgi:hypothetical protein